MLSHFRKNNFFVSTFFVCAAILICLALAVFVKLGDVKTPVIIHFDAYKGIDFLGGRFDIGGIILMGLTVLVLNAFLADILYKREKLLSYVVVFSTMAVTCLIFIGVSVIIGIN